MRFSSEKLNESTISEEKKTKSKEGFLKSKKVTKTKKFYTKTLPKKEETSYRSSSYDPSEGIVIYEDYYERSSSSCETWSTLQSCPKSIQKSEVKHEKVQGIKNVNYRKSSSNNSAVVPSEKLPKYESLSDLEKKYKESEKKRTESKYGTNLSNITTSRKGGLSSKLILGSLMSPNDRDMAIYTKRKIEQRKKMIADQSKVILAKFGRVRTSRSL